MMGLSCLDYSKVISTFIISIPIPSPETLKGRLRSEPDASDGGVNVAIHDVAEVVQILFVNLLD